MDTNSIVTVYNIMIEYYVYGYVEQFPIFPITPVIQCCVMKTLQIFTSYTNTVVKGNPKYLCLVQQSLWDFFYLPYYYPPHPPQSHLFCFLQLSNNPNPAATTTSEIAKIILKFRTWNNIWLG